MKIFLNTRGGNGPCRRWTKAFLSCLENRGLEIIEVNIFDEESLESIKIHYSPGDFFIGRFSEHRFPTWVTHYNEIADLFGSNKMFPNPNEVFYYNDKERQRILFEKKGYPHPKTIYANDSSDVSLPFPLVRKGKMGSSSKQVSLVEEESQIKFPCLLQEFCDGNDGDIRINVVGDYVMGFKRGNRNNDFRASGGGKLMYVDELPMECVKASCKISKENKFNCMCYDFVKNSKGEWVLLELSYTFLPGAVNACKYKYDSSNDFKRIDNDCSVQELVIRTLLDS